MRVDAQQVGAGADVREQGLRVAGVFGGYRRDAAQGLGRTRREVLQVAEWRRHDVERAGHLTTPPARAAACRTRPPATRSDAPWWPRAGSWASCPALRPPPPRAAAPPSRGPRSTARPPAPRRP